MLTTVSVTSKKTKGYYADGNGLYLQVSASGSKSWIFRFMLRGRAREMGLGSVQSKSLAAARADVASYRQLLIEGIDPIEHRRGLQLKAPTVPRTAHSFRECAEQFHAMHSEGWRNVKHVAQWINTLALYVFPAIGDRDVDEVTRADILTVLEPIWLTKHETASRVRQRIKLVLDWASAREYRTEREHGLWDQMSTALPKTRQLRKPKHYRSCSYERVGMALAAIRTCGASMCVRCAMEFIVLTAARTGMVRMARWEEIDWSKHQWTIPAERMKTGVEHRIPLPHRAMEILEAQRQKSEPEGLIFPTPRNKPHSDMVFTMQLRRLGLAFTMHGFRSTFRDWAAEQTAFPAEVCEAALAHALKNPTEAAYFRSDLFDKRRELMGAWAAYCVAETQAATKPPAE